MSDTTVVDKKGNRNYRPKKDDVSYIREIEGTKYARVYYGTLTKSKPKTVFIEFKTWSTIREESRDADLEAATKRLNKAIRQYLHNTLDEKLFRLEKTLVINTYITRVMAVGKNTYCNTEITLYQKGCLPITNKTNTEITSEVFRIVNGLEVMWAKDSVFKYKRDK